MEIGALCIHHEVATVAEREAFHMNDQEQAEFLKSIKTLGANECTLLMTCGRFEIYYVVDKVHMETYTQKLQAHLDAIQPLPNRWVHHQGKACIGYLFRVTAGLESAVIGEDQILGQVKNALVFSNQHETSGKCLNRIFREAITFSKRVKTELKISQVPLSLSYIAVKKAKQHLTFSNETCISMVGLGKMGCLAINHLLDLPFKALHICVRHPETLPEHLLTHPRINIDHFEERYKYIAQSHLVISSTGAPHTVIREDAFYTHVPNPLIIDLAVPRDVSDVLYKNPTVTIWDVDTLKETSDENLKWRLALIDTVKDWIEEECQSIQLWLEGTKVDDLLKEWHDEIKAIAREGTERVSQTVQKSNALDEDEIERIIQASLRKLLKKPIENLKRITDHNQREVSVRLLKELYEYD